MFAVLAVGQFSGAHLNPAVTLGFAVIGNTDWGDVPKYLAGEFSGAFIGACLVAAAYSNHWRGAGGPGVQLGGVSTGPGLPQTGAEIGTRIIGDLLVGVGGVGGFAQRVSAGAAVVVGGVVV